MADPHIILASGSSVRAQLLSSSGYNFLVETSNLDEQAIKTKAQDNAWLPDDLCLALATEKAKAVSKNFPDTLVIGCDQLLLCDGRLMNKAKNLTDAFDKIKSLQARDHQLISAAAIVQGSDVKITCLDRAIMTMRTLTDGQINSYLEKAGPDILGSVGCYHFEGLGRQLFDRVVGDYTTVLGLPLTELIIGLRQLGIDPLGGIDADDKKDERQSMSC